MTAKLKLSKLKLVPVSWLLTKSAIIVIDKNEHDKVRQGRTSRYSNKSTNDRRPCKMNKMTRNTPKVTNKDQLALEKEHKISTRKQIQVRSMEQSTVHATLV